MHLWKQSEFAEETGRPEKIYNEIRNQLNMHGVVSDTHKGQVFFLHGGCFQISGV